MQPLRMSFLSKFHFKADIVYFVFVKNYFSYLNFVFSVLTMFFKKKKLETKSVIYVFIALLE